MDSRDTAVSDWAIIGLRVAQKLKRYGYSALTERERMIAAFLLTPGGCPGCGGSR